MEERDARGCRTTPSATFVYQLQLRGYGRKREGRIGCLLGGESNSIKLRTRQIDKPIWVKSATMI